MTEKRKLAAILAADVVGFSRLAGADTLVQNRTIGDSGLNSVSELDGAVSAARASTNSS